MAISAVNIIQQIVVLICIVQTTCFIHQISSPASTCRLHLSGSSEQTNKDHIDEVQRRSFLKHSLQTISFLGLQSDTATARGLARFPCKDPLLNTYHFMRAGLSLLEEENIWSTNPLFLTNREAALSEVGEAQVRNACRLLSSSGKSPTVVRYSLAAACVDSANVVGEELRVGRDRLVPEFNYLDPRAIGGWDFAALNETMEAVWAMDEKEAGPYGKGGRPPPNEDGTPAETLSDQVVRLTNLFSVLETLYSGDSVLLIFPDGTGPALLSCLIGGVPLNRVHEFNYQPGEVRFNVDYTSVNAMAAQQTSQSYSDIVQRGRDQLQYLRDHPNEKRNIKDLKYDEERLEEERLESEKKKRAEAKLKKEAAAKRQKSVEINAEYSNSFNTEVGLGAAALLAGGIGIAGTFSNSDVQSTKQLESTVDATQYEVNGKNQSVTRTEQVVSDSALAEAQRSGSTKSEFAYTGVDLDGLLTDGKSSNSQQPEFDYEDDWLGAITDILNEDGSEVEH